MTDESNTVGLFWAPQVILFNADIERTSAFYQKLGFLESFRVPREGTPIHVDLELDSYKIGFAPIKSSRDDHGLNPAQAGQRGTITLWTADTPAVSDAARRRCPSPVRAVSMARPAAHRMG